MVGGLVFSQLLTLYVTPVFYVFFERLRNVRARRGEGGAGVTPPDRSAAAPHPWPPARPPGE